MILAAIVLLTAASAIADVTTFSGLDNAAPVSGPFPNSSAAYAAFAASAQLLGPIATITFEDQPAGLSPSFLAAPGVTVDLSGSFSYFNGLFGISDTTLGNVYGFNTTPGGNKWLGAPGESVTRFTFANPTSSFGVWLTGIQKTFYGNRITISFDDGSSVTLEPALTEAGGAQFFGFTDPGKAITAVSISDANHSSDAWGIDDVVYNTSTVPEPSSLLLVATLGAVFWGAIRRRQA